jgi:signal transduction histidine kinase
VSLFNEHGSIAEGISRYNSTMADPIPTRRYISSASPAPGPGAEEGKRPRRIRRENDRIARLNQLAEMGKLAAGLAHELKNPLSTLKLNLQLMEEDLAQLPGAQRSLARLGTLKKEAERLRQTLDDFLRFAGRIELRLEPVSINSLVEDLIDFIHPQAQASRIRVHPALAAEDPQCRLDSNLFKQALLNLLLNAVQAMPDGGELIVRTIAAKDRVVLYVSDTGIGIPRENLPHIFDAYFTTKKGGTGLGLPTTRRVIEEHNGHITVQSDPGHGTSFRIELPCVE